jgi:cytochrome c peroxidase
MTAQEKADIVAFLESLTDQAFITDRRFSDPWPERDGQSDTLR